VRHPTFFRPTILAIGLAMATALVAWPSVAGAVTPGCLVRDMGTKKTFGKLQPAVDAAATTASLEVRGTCKGTTIITGKTITITGVPTTTRGKPSLTGNDSVRIMEVKKDAIAILARITLRNGRVSGSSYPANSGAAILVRGRVTLLGSVVRDNQASGASSGSGAIEVLDTGTLVVAGSSEIKGNVGSYGGAIENYGKTTIRDTSSIHDNRATKDGGAIYNGNKLGTDSLIIRDSATIHHNQANNGGAIAIGKGTLTMMGKAKIKANTATVKGGGILRTGGTLIGVKCGTNVLNNTPDQVSPTCPI
jgi:hypothetical protein